MMEKPNRKKIRIENYDYSYGTYFVTVCTANREKVLWNIVGADIIRPNCQSLSDAGRVVEKGILQISEHYENVSVNKYCIILKYSMR